MLTNIEKVLLLQSVELFSRVTLEQLFYMAAITREITVPPGRQLFAEKDAPDGLYIVVSGSVLLRRSGEEINRITPNGAFGVWALFDDEPRLAAAESVEESRLLFIPREDFYDVLSNHAEIMEGLFKHLVQRLRKLVDLDQAGSSPESIQTELIKAFV